MKPMKQECHSSSKANVFGIKVVNGIDCHREGDYIKVGELFQRTVRDEFATIVQKRMGTDTGCNDRSEPKA